MILCKLIEKLLIKRHCPRVLRAVYSPPVSLKQLTLEGCILLWFSEASEKGLLISSQRFQGLSTAKKVLCENNFSETSFRRKRTSKIFPIVPGFCQNVWETQLGVSQPFSDFLGTFYNFLFGQNYFPFLLVKKNLPIFLGCRRIKISWWLPTYF